MRPQILGILGLSIAVLTTALTVIYTQHQSRKSFVNLQELQKVRDDIDVEWGRLQLEQGAWTTHGRVEQIARIKLDMKIPNTDAVVIVNNMTVKPRL